MISACDEGSCPRATHYLAVAVVATPGACTRMKVGCPESPAMLCCCVCCLYRAQVMQLQPAGCLRTEPAAEWRSGILEAERSGTADWLGD